MRHLLLKLEPVIWLLFGQGILIGTMLLTAYLAIVGVAIPLGIVPAEALSHERALGLGSSHVGRVVLFGLIALHIVLLAAVIFVGVRFFRLFPKSQPAKIGPAKPPPRPIIHAMLYAAWIAVSGGLALILAGGIF